MGGTVVFLLWEALWLPHRPSKCFQTGSYKPTAILSATHWGNKFMCCRYKVHLSCNGIDGRVYVGGRLALFRHWCDWHCRDQQKSWSFTRDRTLRNIYSRPHSKWLTLTSTGLTLGKKSRLQRFFLVLSVIIFSIDLSFNIFDHRFV